MASVDSSAGSAKLIQRVSDAEPITQPVAEYQCRQEPRIAVVERSAGKIEPGQYRIAARPAGDGKTDLATVVSGARNALAAIAHAVVKAVALTEMRHPVKGKSDEAHPGMAYAYLPQGGEDLGQHRVQSGHATRDVVFVRRGASAEEDPGAIRGRPVIDDDPSRIAYVAAVRYQTADQSRIERFGRDDIAADRQDPAAVPRRELSGVAIARNQHLSGPQHALVRKHFEPGRRTSQG